MPKLKGGIKKEMVTNSIPKFVMAFTMIILGVVFTSVIATQTNTVTNPTTVTNESLDISGARIVGNQINTSRTFTLANTGLADAGGLVTNSVVIRNNTGQTLAGNFTVTYTVYPDTIAFSNNTYMVSGGGLNNNTLVTYQYYQSSYLNSDWAQSALNMLGGFMALSLLGVGIALFYGIAKENKIV